MQSVKVLEINFTDFQQEILHLREKVWKETDYLHSQQVFAKGFLDKMDFEAFHWAVFDENDAIIASARLSVHQRLEDIPDIFHIENLKELADLKPKFPIASLNRLVVDKNYHNKGMSKIFDDIRFKKAKNLKCQSICVMTYGNRVNKLKSYKFTVYPFLTFSNNFQTNKYPIQTHPPAFCYKEFELN